MKHGDTFAVFDHGGDALGWPGSPEGVFHQDTRYLSHFQLMIDGRRPVLLSSTVRDDNAVLSCDLTNPEIEATSDSLELRQDLLHIRRTRFLWNARVFERIAVNNFDIASRRVRLQVVFASDFSDIFEVRGTRRERRGTPEEAAVEQDAVTLAYTGLDKRRRETRLQFEPAPDQIEAGHAVFDVLLGPGEQKTVFVEVLCGVGLGARSPRRAFFSSLRDARRELRKTTSRAASLSTSNAVFNETVRRAVSDLYMLVTETPNGPYPYAGIPWFSTVFGRDALITALQTLWLDPVLARGVLQHLAANQAAEIDAAADAEPGKILHEVRLGEMAELGEVPFRRYYGSVNSTPLFVLLAGAYLERTGDVETLRGIWRNVEAALSWLETYGDRDGDGFVEYDRRNAKGLVNQGWKDSHDSVFHEDGTLAEGPIALVEVQAYAYGAWRAAAKIAERLQQPSEQVMALNWRADELQRRFEQTFFDEALGTYVLALDGQKRPCRVRSSNAGHALFTGIASPERARAGRACADASELVHRLGHSDDPDDRGALQSHELSQWLRLAARQRADRRRNVALRLPRGGGAHPHGPLRGVDLYRPQAPARAFLRFFATAQSRPDVLSRRLFSAGLGSRRIALDGPVLPRYSVSAPRQGMWSSTIRYFRISSRAPPSASYGFREVGSMLASREPAPRSPRTRFPAADRSTLRSVRRRRPGSDFLPKSGLQLGLLSCLAWQPR